MNSNIINVEDSKETEIIEPGPVVYEDSISIFDDIYDEVIKKTDIMICSGSLVRGLEDNFYRRLVEIANGLNIKTIVDTSKLALKEAIKAKPFMIKPNINELGEYFDCKISGVEGVKKLKKIIDGR